MSKVPVKKVFRSFQIFPAQCDALQSRGILPERPRGQMTPEYILALAEYCRTRRGPLSPEAEALIKSVKADADE